MQEESDRPLQLPDTKEVDSTDLCSALSLCVCVCERDAAIQTHSYVVGVDVGAQEVVAALGLQNDSGMRV